MFWNSKAKRRRSALAAAIGDELVRVTKSQRLASAADDAERVRLCAIWQDEARAAWYEGLRQSRLAILQSRDLRYASMGPRERIVIGDRLWATSPDNKDLAGAEQMYARWVLAYEAQIRARGSE